jgi:hypothetical protein
MRKLVQLTTVDVFHFGRGADDITDLGNQALDLATR